MRIGLPTVMPLGGRIQRILHAYTRKWCSLCEKTRQRTSSVVKHLIRRFADRASPVKRVARTRLKIPGIKISLRLSLGLKNILSMQSRINSKINGVKRWELDP